MGVADVFAEKNGTFVDWQKALKLTSNTDVDLSSNELFTVCCRCREVLTESVDAAARCYALACLENIIRNCSDSSPGALATSHCMTVIIRSIEAKVHRDTERIRALRVVKALVDLRPETVTIGIVRVLSVVCASTDDPASMTCMQLLAHLCESCPLVVARGGGLKALAKIAGDPSLDTVNSIALSRILSVCSERKEVRSLIYPGRYLVSLCAPITDIMVAPSDKSFELALKNLKTCLISWHGLCELCVDPAGLPAVVSILKLPGMSPKKLEIVQTFVDVLLQPRIDTKDIKQHLKSVSSGAISRGKAYSPFSRSHASMPSGTDGLMAVILQQLLKFGLVDILIQLGQDDEDEELSLQSTYLLVLVLRMADALLPLELLPDLQALPQLVRIASAFRQLDHSTRSHASNLLHNLNTLSLKQSVGHDISHGQGRGFGRRGLDAAIARRGDGSVTDSEYNTMLRGAKATVAQALDTDGDDYSRMSDSQIDALADFIDGPLSTPGSRRLADLLRKDDFLQLLFTWISPRCVDGFMNKPRTEKYQQLGKSLSNLIFILLQSPEGVDFLQHNRVIRDISEALQAEVPMPDDSAAVRQTARPTENTQRSFSKDNISSDETRALDAIRVTKSMSREVFAFIGVMTQHDIGLSLLKKNDVMSALQKLVDSHRVDITKLAIDNLDYSKPGTARDFLSIAMRSHSKLIRFYATKRLQKLLEVADVADFNSWCVELLVTQLRDDDKEVVNVTIRVLEEACEFPAVLRTMVEMGPALFESGIRSKVSHLLLKMCSDPAGLKLMNDFDLLSAIIKEWCDQGWRDYVKDMDNFVKASLSLKPKVVRSRSSQQHTQQDFEQHPADESYAPHLVGMLFHSEEGRDLLISSSNHLEIIDQNLSNDHDETLCRSALMTMGHMLRTPLGRQETLKRNWLQKSVGLLKTCSNARIIGTVLSALGMMEDDGETAADCMRELGILPNGAGSAIPKCSEIWFGFESQWKCALSTLAVEGPSDIPEHGATYRGQAEDQSLEPAIIHEILESIGKMLIPVSASQGREALIKLKAGKPEYFESPTVLMACWEMADSGGLPLHVRRAVQDLFSGCRASTFWPNK